MKVKHNGGTKTLREKFARELCLALERGEKEPIAPFKLYPGFREFALKNFSSEAIKLRREQGVQEHSPETFENADNEESRLEASIEEESQAEDSSFPSFREREATF